MSGIWHHRCCCAAGQWWPFIVSYEAAAPYKPVIFYPKVPEGFDEEVLDWASLHSDQLIACAYRKIGTAWCPSLLWCETPDYKLVLATKYPLAGWYCEEIKVGESNLLGTPNRLLFNDTEPDVEARVWYRCAVSPYGSYRANYDETTHTWSSLSLDADSDFYLLFRQGAAMPLDGSGSEWCSPIHQDSLSPYRMIVKAGTYSGDLDILWDANYGSGAAISVTSGNVPCVVIGYGLSGATYDSYIILKRRTGPGTWTTHNVWSEADMRILVRSCAVDLNNRVFIVWVRGISPSTLDPKELWCSHAVIDEWEWTHELVDTSGSVPVSYASIGIDQMGNASMIVQDPNDPLRNIIPYVRAGGSWRKKASTAHATALQVSALDFADLPPGL